jgi:hypothetical protein
MTKKVSESGQPDDEHLEANPDLDDGKGDELTSGNDGGQPEVDLKELADTVSKLTAVVQTLQGDKDRGVNKALQTAEQAKQDAETLKGQVEKILQLSGQGLDADKIAAKLAEVSMEERLANIENLLLELRTGGTGTNFTAAQRQVISEVGLKEDDQAVVDAIRNGLKGDALRAELAMAALKQAKRPSPGASSAGQLDGGKTDQDDEIDISKIDDADELYKLAGEDFES